MPRRAKSWRSSSTTASTGSAWCAPIELSFRLHPEASLPSRGVTMSAIRALCAGALLALASIAALAQQYPTRSVVMLVPYAAGGPTDTVARVVAQFMAKPLGQTVVVENKPSAGGILAPEQVKNAKPDGYTILIHHVGMATTPALYRQLRFNPLTDFDYIGLVNDVPMTLIAK